MGKSTLAIQLGKYIDKKFDLIKNICYLPTTEELEDKFYSLPQFSVFVIDEAIKVVYKLRWQEKIQIRINEMYATERWQNKCTLMLIPRFTDLNEYFRNQRVKLWIHILSRGYCLIFKPVDENMFSKDPWDIKNNYKILNEFFLKNRRFIYEFDREMFEKILNKNCINFVASFEFEDLDEETKSKYRELKALSRPKAQELMKQDKIEIRMHEKAVALRKLIEKGFTQTEAGEIFGMTGENVCYLLKKYIKNKPKIDNESQNTII